MMYLVWFTLVIIFSLAILGAFSLPKLLTTGTVCGL